MGELKQHYANFSFHFRGRGGKVVLGKSEVLNSRSVQKCQLCIFSGGGGRGGGVKWHFENLKS